MTGRDYKNKRDYVALLNYALRAFPDHEGIAYVNTEDNEEYVKIWDQIGGAVYLDVTNYEMYQIFDSVALVMRGQVPSNITEDRETRRGLVHLFRQEVARQTGIMPEKEEITQKKNISSKKETAEDKKKESKK